MVSVAESIAHIQRERAEAEARAKGYSPAKAERFRTSAAWRRVRFTVLAASAARNNGEARCELCGRGRRDRNADGTAVILDVDHVEPISRGGWERRFDASRCQVLCSICNRDGKGNRSSDDFRPPEEAPA